MSATAKLPSRNPAVEQICEVLVKIYSRNFGLKGVKELRSQVMIRKRDFATLIGETVRYEENRVILDSEQLRMISNDLIVFNKIALVEIGEYLALIPVALEHDYRIVPIDLIEDLKLCK
jgi:hypothetical protein